MLPYWRILLQFLLTSGVERTFDFFSKNKLVFFEQEDIINCLTIFYRLLDEEELSFLKNKPLHQRVKWGPIVNRICSKIKKEFGFDLIPFFKETFLEKDVLRIVKNRELRIFVEVLKLSGAEDLEISDFLSKRFKLKTPISPVAIKNFCFWFFSVEDLDDIDWQNYLAKFSLMGVSVDQVFLAESEDKFFALRHSKNDVLCRLGLHNDISYPEMLSMIKNAYYDRIVNDIESGADLDHINNKVTNFLRLGIEHEKISPSNAIGNVFLDGVEYCVDTFDVDRSPILEEGSLLAYDDQKNNK